ncbi:MAG: glycoside hydrolase family 43 protein [Bacteroidota bacterium]|nr:glycoside hydrolase family 43 protein [Bacteroidota bacterium]
MNLNRKFSTRVALVLLLLVGLLCNSQAQNPIIQTNYTANVASLVYKDKFYIYVGRDEASPTGRWFNMHEWRIYSSTDMVNWTDHGAKLKVTDFKWASGDAWASQCIYHKGKFYWYVSVSHKEKGGKAIGVAVSDSPTGPFVDAKGSAIITTDMTPNQGDFDDIDPTVFVDDDGQSYMYWGNGKCKYVKLNDDMISFSGQIQYANVPKFGEAPWLQKINGKYYLSYSSSSPSTIEYCTSSTPVGPWDYQGRILNIVENCPTSHQAITDFKGKWYFVYHNGVLPGGNGFHRSVCIEEFTLKPNGSIPLLTSTKEGVKTGIGHLNPYERVEAETMAWSEGVEAASDNTAGVYITNINDGDYIKVRSVDLKKGAKQFLAHAASSSKGEIEIRTGSIYGDIIGVCKVNSTGGLDKWTTLNSKVKKVKGIHDLYFVFKGGEGKFLNLDWWKLQ